MARRSSPSNCVRLASGDTSETPVVPSSSHVNCVSPASGDTSETPVVPSFSHVNCVSPASGDTSETPVARRSSAANCVNPDSGDTSETPVARRSSAANCVNPDSGDTSETPVKSRISTSNCVSPASGDTSETPVWLRCSTSNCVSADRGDQSEIALLLTDPSPLMYSPLRSNAVRFVACSSPVKSFIPRLLTKSRGNANIACVVMASLPDNSRASRTADARFGSGIETTLAGGKREGTSIGKDCADMWPRTSITESVTSSICGVNAVVTNSTVSWTSVNR